MAAIDPKKRYVIKGDTLQKLMQGIDVTKDQLKVENKNGKQVVSFAHVRRFKVIWNGAVATFEVPAVQANN